MDRSESRSDTIWESLKGSGFPFQTAVVSVIQRVPEWSVVGTEVSWVDAQGGDQFLDLVAQCGMLTLTVECKKTRKDVLTFLQPAPRNAQIDRAHLLYAARINDMTQRLELYTGIWGIAPVSDETQFCVVSTSKEGRDQRLLERDAQRLVRATDAYALRSTMSERMAGPPASRPRVPMAERAFVPVIVTNAPLYVVQYEPDQISLASGEFTHRPKTVTPVPWVRFRKSFTSSGGKDLGERTVLVVAALSVAEFLVAAEAEPQRPLFGPHARLPRPGT